MNERATAIDPVAIMAQPNWQIAAIMTAVVAILLLAALVYSIRFTAAVPRLQRVRVTARGIGEAGTSSMTAVAPLFVPRRAASCVARPDTCLSSISTRCAGCITICASSSTAS